MYLLETKRVDLDFFSPILIDALILSHGSLPNPQSPLYMKIAKFFIVALSCGLLFTLNSQAESVYQKAPGEAALKGDGKSAKDVLETNPNTQADSGKVVRLKGSLGQWDYVAYWFGLKVPAGDSVLRFRVYNDGNPAASYAIYMRDANGQNMVGKLDIPADAKKDSFVDIDLPVTATEEWSGVIVKKAEKSDKPSPWIDTVSAVLP